ncbi:ComF family protein [Spirochaetota bacterium]
MVDILKFNNKFASIIRVTGILDLLFPSACINCKKPVKFEENSVCNECLSSVKLIEEKCERCSGIIEKGKCTICSDREFYIKKNIAVAEYSGLIKELLHVLKFNKRRRLYRHLSKIAYPELLKSKIDCDMLSSVPMSSTNRWERGFNQSELISKDLSSMLGLPYHELLRENRNTISQKGLGYRDRFINVLNKYCVNDPSFIIGKKILLVDDVFTTGATMNECARILLESGALEICSLTIARAKVDSL